MGGAVQVKDGLPPPPDGGWGWVVVFASFMIHIFADGMTYSFGVFYNELITHFGEGAAATSWISSILVGVTLCSGPISSALVNKFGCRAVTIAGAFLASFSIAISYYAESLLTLYITIGLLTGLGLGLMYLPAIVCVTIYFEKYRSLATGIAVCGSGLGTFILAPVTKLFVDWASWRGAFLLVGGLMLNCIVFGILFRPLPEEPEEIKLEDIKADDASVDDAIDENGKQSRPHSIHGQSMFVVTNGGAPAPIATSSVVSENNRLAQSQPHLLVTERRRSHGVMYRKDVFYSGSVLNLSKSAPWLNDHHQYHQQYLSPEERALMRTQGAKSPRHRNDKAVVFHCFLCPKETADTLNEMLNSSLLFDPIFLIFAISNFATSIGFNVPYLYLVSMCVSQGIPEGVATWTLSIIGIANMIGRIILGYVSDKPEINRLNVYIVCLTIAGIGTALCSFCTDFIAFAVYSVVYGFTIGAYVGLTSVILVDFLGLDKLTNAFGLLLLFQGIASLVGPPITGFLYDQTKSYGPGFILSGLIMAGSGLVLFTVPPLKRCLDRRAARQAS